jgi:hypothetical protein
MLRSSPLGAECGGSEAAQNLLCVAGAICPAASRAEEISRLFVVAVVGLGRVLAPGRDPRLHLPSMKSDLPSHDSRHSSDPVFRARKKGAEPGTRSIEVGRTPRWGGCGIGCYTGSPLHDY